MRAQIQLFAAFRACLPMVVIVALPYIVDEMAKRNFHRCAFRLGRGGLAVGCANLYGVAARLCDGQGSPVLPIEEHAVLIPSIVVHHAFQLMRGAGL